MTVSTTPRPGLTAREARFDAICDELAELCGQQNVIAWRIAELLAEVEGDGHLGGTGVRSLEHFATWQLGVSRSRAQNLAAIARRLDDLPTTTGLLREGLLSEDQTATIARRAPTGADEHYAELARSATVTQLRTALRAAPKPKPDHGPPPEPDDEVRAWWDDDDRYNVHVRLQRPPGAVADSALRAHHEALVNEWRRERDAGAEPSRPFPTLADAYRRMTEHSLDAEAHLRPHGHRSTVIVHVDADDDLATLHLGPALTDAERRLLACDARFQVWFERHGIPIGVGRTTRTIPQRLRRAVEHRSMGTCERPGCDARMTQIHHLWHWLDGGPTELWNLLGTCTNCHTEHHRGAITIRGTADHLEILDRRGYPLTGAGLARPPTTAPRAARYEHPSGEKVEWRWYDPPSLC